MESLQEHLSLRPNTKYFLAKTEDQSTEQWIENLEEDAGILYFFSRGHLYRDVLKLNDKDIGKLFDFHVHCSDEPQYKLLRHLMMFHLLEDKVQVQRTLEINKASEECRKLLGTLRKLDTKGDKSNVVRYLSETLYYQGLSVDTIVDRLIKLDLLPEFSNDEAKSSLHESHSKIIYGYKKDFSFVRKEDMVSKVDFTQLQQEIDPHKFDELKGDKARDLDQN
tara:strand:- start:495 stop:1160 length:666 start_codon:yes stop_codon:yes gene_type:complete